MRLLFSPTIISKAFFYSVFSLTHRVVFQAYFSFCQFISEWPIDTKLQYSFIFSPKCIPVAKLLILVITINYKTFTGYYGYTLCFNSFQMHFIEYCTGTGFVKSPLNCY